MTLAFESVMHLGFIYALVAIAVYITFRILNEADLTIEGSFPLGACVAASLLLYQCPMFVAITAAITAGCIAGIITAALHIYLRLISLLASIITLSMMYSINLRVMGKPNIALLSINNLITNYPLPSLILTLLIIVICLQFFFHTEIGLAMRLIGRNPKLAVNYGFNKNKAVLFLFAVSNGLVALAGALFAITQGFADISLGNGTIVNGLAALFIGESIFRKSNITLQLYACIIGSLLYRFVIALALNSQDLGFLPSDINLITAMLIIFIIALPILRNRTMVRNVSN